ncbi:MAG TPA: hypothetical protein VEI24_03715 [Nitrospiria bacterium]|nr:hypothetical protein [Nitrospiria bacterium]
MKFAPIPILSLLVIWGGSVAAQTDTERLYPTHTFEVGPAFSYITYKEPHMKIDGMVYGIVVSYAYHNHVMLKGEFNGNYGKIDYSGSTMTGTPVSGDNTLNEMWELRGLGGYDFPLFTSSIFTPYIGFGVRYLNNDILPTLYERESYYLYSPIGISVLTGLKNGWSIGGTGEYDVFWSGYQNSHPIDDIPNLQSDITSHQTKGYGLRGSITLQRKYKRVVLAGGPFVRYWSVDKLPTTIVPNNVPWQEPGSYSVEVGLAFAVKF